MERILSFNDISDLPDTFSFYHKTDLSHYFIFLTRTRPVYMATVIIRPYFPLSEGLTFFCETMTDGTGRYYTRKGTERVNPKGYLPKGIRVDGGKASLRFRKDGFAGTGEEYNIFLTTDNGKYGRMITVAMYTGRVRVRKIK